MRDSTSEMTASCRRCHGDPFVGVSVVLQRSYNNFPVGPFQSDFWVLVRVGRFSYSHIFEVISNPSLALFISPPTRNSSMNRNPRQQPQRHHQQLRNSKP